MVLGTRPFVIPSSDYGHEALVVSDGFLLVFKNRHSFESDFNTNDGRSVC